MKKDGFLLALSGREGIRLLSSSAGELSSLGSRMPLLGRSCMLVLPAGTAECHRLVVKNAGARELAAQAASPYTGKGLSIDYAVQCKRGDRAELITAAVPRSELARWKKEIARLGIWITGAIPPEMALLRLLRQKPQGQLCVIDRSGVGTRLYFYSDDQFVLAKTIPVGEEELSGIKKAIGVYRFNEQEDLSQVSFTGEWPDRLSEQVCVENQLIRLSERQLCGEDCGDWLYAMGAICGGRADEQA